MAATAPKIAAIAAHPTVSLTIDAGGTPDQVGWRASPSRRTGLATTIWRPVDYDDRWTEQS